jgi:hypothetical protein
MNVYHLGFATIELLDEETAELIVSADIEMSARMVDTLHSWLLARTPESRKLLVNRINTYSYSSDARLKLTSFQRIAATAIVIPPASSLTAFATLKSAAPADSKRIVATFDNRAQALEWLKSQ